MEGLKINTELMLLIKQDSIRVVLCDCESENSNIDPHVKMDFILFETALHLNAVRFK